MWDPLLSPQPWVFRATLLRASAWFYHAGLKGPCRGGHVGLLALVSRMQFHGVSQSRGAGVSELLLKPLPTPRDLEQQAGPLGRALRVSLTHSLFTS